LVRSRRGLGLHRRASRHRTDRTGQIHDAFHALRRPRAHAGHRRRRLGALRRHRPAHRQGARPHGLGPVNPFNLKKPMRRFVDLSIYLENDVLSDPPPLAPRIEYQTHKDTIEEFTHLLPGTKPEDFPEGEAAAAEWVRLTTHSGTHLDAPWHFHSTMDGKTGEAKPSI